MTPSKCNRSLVTRCSMKSVKALAHAGRVVTIPPARTVPTGLVAEPAHGVGARHALLLGAVRAAVALVADAAPDLHGVPGLAVVPARQLREDLLWEALPTAVTILINKIHSMSAGTDIRAFLESSYLH